MRETHSGLGAPAAPAPCVLGLCVACLRFPVLLRRCGAPRPLLMHLLPFLSLSNFPSPTSSLKHRSVGTQEAVPENPCSQG